MKKQLTSIFTLAILVGLFAQLFPKYSSGSSTGLAGFNAQNIPPVAGGCQRPAAGSIVTNPPDLYSHNGILSVDFSYQTATDADGRQLLLRNSQRPGESHPARQPG
jgi:hypothetical protein